MNTTQERLFIGSKAVIDYNEEDMKVKFVLDDGSGDTITKDQFETIARPARYDDGMVRVYKWNSAVIEIMGVLLKNNMKLIEKDFVTQQIDSTIVQNYQRAAAELFGASHEELITLESIDKVLKGNNMFTEENNEEVASDVVEETPVEETPVTETPVEEAPVESAE